MKRGAYSACFAVYSQVLVLFSIYTTNFCTSGKQVCRSESSCHSTEINAMLFSNDEVLIAKSEDELRKAARALNKIAVM